MDAYGCLLMFMVRLVKPKFDSLRIELAELNMLQFLGSAAVSPAFKKPPQRFFFSSRRW